jgi:guanylate kinase
MTARPSVDKGLNSDPIRRGHLFVVSAPSGAGKTTICRHVLQRMPDLMYSVSHTTRAPRSDEVPGRDYHFISTRRFEEKIDAGDWAEWARVHGNYYGTSAAFIQNNLARGRDILLDIDVQGTLQIIKAFPDSVTIFILPPSFEVLRQRLESRGTDSREVIETRLRNARREMDSQDIYRYRIVNVDLETAIGELIGIIQHCRSGQDSP